MISSRSSSASPPRFCHGSDSTPGGFGSAERSRLAATQEVNPMSIQFDRRGPHQVEELDVPFARPKGQELLARIYRPRGEPSQPLAAIVDVHGGAWARLDRTAGA